MRWLPICSCFSSLKLNKNLKWMSFLCRDPEDHRDDLKGNQREMDYMYTDKRPYSPPPSDVCTTAKHKNKNLSHQACHISKYNGFILSLYCILVHLRPIKSLSLTSIHHSIPCNVLFNENWLKVLKIHWADDKWSRRIVAIH